MTPPLAPAIPDFTLVRLLGQGGFGAVWLGRSMTGVHRAVKTIDRSAHPEIEFEGIRVYERRVTDHSHLIDVRHVGETDTHLYYVMELADSYSETPTFAVEDYEPRTLDSELRRRGALPEAEAKQIAAEVAHGLAHLHSLGLLHRDVKPANIVFVDGRAKLADLGLVGQSDGRDAPGLTPTYAPPEGIVSPDGDLYCLGRVYYEMLSGSSPADFPSFPADANEERIAAISRAMPIIDRACAPDPTERFSSAAAFLTAIGWEDETAPSTPAAPPKASILSRAAMLLVGLGLIWAAATQPWKSGETEETGAALEIIYKADADDPAAKKLGIETAPLQTGDSIAITASVPSPEYLLVLQLERGLSGEIELLVLNDDRGQQAMTEWRGPSDDPTSWWTIAPPEGTLVYVLLGAPEPVRDVDGLLARLGSIESLPELGPRQMMTFDGELASLIEGRRRGIRDPEKTVQTRAGSLEQLRILAGEQFTRVEAIAVSQVADPLKENPP